MFTGIVEEIGRIAEHTSVKGGIRMAVRAPRAAAKSAAGDSIAVSGVCQTVERVDGERVWFTAVGETIRRTTFGSLRLGSEVNIELAATPQTALGGHFVQGHVDGVGTVESFARHGDDHLLAVRLPQELSALVVEKGSIAIDGVSLTVVEPKERSIITITIIPFTWEHTVVKHYRRGTRVNVEADIIGKYIINYLERSGINRIAR